MVVARRTSKYILLAVILAAAGTSNYGRAQSPSPDGSRPRLTLQGAAEPGTSIVRDALNRPCLDVEAAARGHVANKSVVDHVVSIKNNCARLIKTKICYFRSESCKEFDLQPYKRVDTILGTTTSLYFRYSVFQK